MTHFYGTMSKETKNWLLENYDEDIFREMERKHDRSFKNQEFQKRGVISWTSRAINFLKKS